MVFLTFLFSDETTGLSHLLLSEDCLSMILGDSIENLATLPLTYCYCFCYITLETKA